MQQISTESATILVVEVPEGAYKIHLLAPGDMNNRSKKKYAITMFLPLIPIPFSFKQPWKDYTKTLPPGEWEYVNTLKDITEEQAAGMVDAHEYPFAEGEYCFIDYSNTKSFSATTTALESLRSLLKANGIRGDNHVILKLK